MKKILNKSNNIIKGFLTFVLFFSSSYIQKILAYDIFRFKKITMKEAIIVNCIASGIITILIILLHKSDLKKEWKIFKDNLSDNIDIGFKYWFIGLALMMVTNIIISFVFNAGQANNEQTVQKMIDTLPILTLISAGLFAPITEEITFRKVFKDNIKNKVLFVLVAGIVFGYLHVTSANSLAQFLYIIPYSSLGICFAISYSKTDTVFTSMTMHMLHNTILTILSILV